MLPAPPAGRGASSSTAAALAAAAVGWARALMPSLPLPAILHAQARQPEGNLLDSRKQQGVLQTSQQPQRQQVAQPALRQSWLPPLFMSCLPRPAAQWHQLLQLLRQRSRCGRLVLEPLKKRQQQLVLGQMKRRYQQLVLIQLKTRQQQQRQTALWVATLHNWTVMRR